MAKRYNSKKRISVLNANSKHKSFMLCDILRTEFATHQKLVRRYANTPDNWKEQSSNKTKQEKNYDLLKYAFEGNKKMVNYALAVGADINAVDSCGNNALMLAVYSGDVDTVKYLINFHKDEKGNIKEGVVPINLEKINDDCLSILHLAVYMNNAKIVKMLLDAGLNANIVDKYYESPLFTATKKNNEEMIDILLNCNQNNFANKNQQNREGLTPLMIASQNKNRQEAFVKLLNNKANLFITDNQGKNALMHAANNNCSVYMDMLLKKAGDRVLNLMNHQDNEGVSTLMILAKRGNREALRVFIARGANPFLVDKFGDTALDYAIKFGNPTCIDILTKANKIYKQAYQIEDADKRTKFLQENLGIFAKQNRVENSCVK